MRIIWDGRSERMYGLGRPTMTSGLVQMITEVSRGLAERGHTVHVLTADLDVEEQRGANLWYWPASYGPTVADAVIATQQINPSAGLDAPVLVLAHTGCDPYLGEDGEWAEGVEAFPVFSQAHGDLLRKARPTIPAEKVHVVGLGVNTWEYREPVTKVHGRMLYLNDPVRGLLPLLDIFDRVRKEVPEASLHVAYDFERQLAVRAWEHSQMAQMLWECKRRIESTEGVVNLGNLTREQVVREQLACQVHAMPSDPPNVGTQTHGIAQMECAAAGCALVLSDIEAFPEVFGQGATILPTVGKYVPALGRRYTADDWAAVVVELMRDGDKWQEASRKARALAEQNTWEGVVERWERMLEQLGGAVA